MKWIFPAVKRKQKRQLLLQPVTTPTTQTYDTRSDIFSLGACFTEILSALVEDDIPGAEGEDEKDVTHVNPVSGWAQHHEEHVRELELKSAFHVFRYLIRYDPKKTKKQRSRWAFKEVIKHLADPKLGDRIFSTGSCKELVLSVAESLDKTRYRPNPVQSENGPIPQVCAPETRREHLNPQLAETL